MLATFKNSLAFIYWPPTLSGVLDTTVIPTDIPVMSSTLNALELDIDTTVVSTSLYNLGGKAGMYLATDI